MKKKVIFIVGALVLAAAFYFVATSFFGNETVKRDPNNSNITNEPINNITPEDKNYIIKNGKKVTVEDIEQFTCNAGYTMKEGMCVKYNYIEAVKNIYCTKGNYNGVYCIAYSDKQSNNFTVDYTCDEGFTKNDDRCIRRYAVDSEKNCTKNGGTLIASVCVIDTPAKKEVTCLEKNYSYNASKDQCLQVTKTEAIIKYSCNDGYTLDKDKCYVLDKVEPTKNY